MTHSPPVAADADGTGPGDPPDPNLGCQTTGCLAGALLMSSFAAIILLFLSREPHGWLQLFLGVPLAVASVPAWGGALLLRARATGSRAARIAAYVLLAIGTVLVAALAWIVVELF